MMNNANNTWRNVLKGKMIVSALMLALFFNSQIFGMACVPCAGVPTPPTSIWSLVATIYATGEIGTTINNASLPFTITQPGIYSFCEDLLWTGGGAAITINTGNLIDPVIINMAGHRLDIASIGNGIVGVGTSIFTVYNGTIVTSGDASPSTLISGSIDVTKVDFASSIGGNTNSGIVIPGASVIPNLVPRITNCTFRNIASAITAAITPLQVNNCIISGSSLHGIQVTTGVGILELFNSTMENIGGSCVNFAGAIPAASCAIIGCVLGNVSVAVPAITVTGASFTLQETTVTTPVGVSATGTFGVLSGTTAFVNRSIISGMTVANSTALSLNAYDVTTVARATLEDATGTNIGGIAITAGGSATITDSSLVGLTGQAWLINNCNNALINTCLVEPAAGALLTTNATSIANTPNVLVQECIINNAQVTSGSILSVTAPANGILQAIVRNCALLDCNNTATVALLAVTSTSTVSAAYIEGCRILNASSAGGAIMTTSIGDVNIRDCSVQNYIGLGAAAIAILAAFGNAVEISSCILEDITNAVGIFSSFCAAPLLDNCSIKNLNGTSAFAVDHCASVLIRNSAIQNAIIVPLTGLGVLLGSTNSPSVIVDTCRVSDIILTNASAINCFQATSGLIRNCLLNHIVSTGTAPILGLDMLVTSTTNSGLIDGCDVNNVVNAAANAIQISNALDGVVQNCIIQQATVINAIGLTIGMTNALIKSNRVFDITGNGIDVVATTTTDFFNNVVNVVTGIAYQPASGVGGAIVSIAGSGGNIPAGTGYWSNIAP